jgi:glycosyltransferase involved in cell wall biosynthesis
MKINYTMTGFNMTGGPLVLFNIMKRLAERGHQISVTIPKENSHLFFSKIQQITPKKFKDRISLLSARGVSAFFRRILKEEIYLNTYRSLDILENITPECDINVATYHLTAFPVFRSKKGMPFYHMQHYEVVFGKLPHQKALAEETYYLPLNKIANSIWLKNQIKEKHGQDVPVINPGIDNDVFKPRKDRDKLKKRIVCYGSNAELKGFKDALEAMKMVFTKRKDIEWIVFGLTDLKYKSDKAPYKLIKGIFNEKLAELYSSADVVICPSWLESFPLPPLEAMACGAPVVTTRFGTEDYCFDGENSLVVPLRNPELMSEAILRLLEDAELSQRIANKAMETAGQFTWETTVEKMEALFKKAISGEH